MNSLSEVELELVRLRDQVSLWLKRLEYRRVRDERGHVVDGYLIAPITDWELLRQRDAINKIIDRLPKEPSL